MLIIPEIETVVILPPRTGTGSLYRAVLDAYPLAFMPYRHMEADGVPFGYDRWRRIGVLRHPVSRLFSLFNYLQTFGDDHQAHGHMENYYRSRKDSVIGKTFQQWVLTNDLPFSVHVDDRGIIRPLFMQNHMMAENKKSQYYYLRPDLGVEIIPYTRDGSAISRELGIEVGHTNNVTGSGGSPIYTAALQDHLEMFHGWDVSECADLGIGMA